MRKLFCCAVTFMCILLLCISAAAESGEEVIGTCTKVLTSNSNSISYGAEVTETTLGDFAAGAVLAETGADIAMICGGDMKHNLRTGDITAEEIHEIFSEGFRILLVRLTPKQLYAVLENAVSHTVIDEAERIDPEASAFGGFIQPGGFCYRYDCSALAGQRMKSITLDSGVVLDPADESTVLTAAISESILREEYGFTVLDGVEQRECGWTEADAVISYIRENPVVSAAALNRIAVIGTAENTIISAVNLNNSSLFVLATCAILVILLIRLPRQKHRLRNMDGSLSKDLHDYDLIELEEE